MSIFYLLLEVGITTAAVAGIGFFLIFVAFAYIVLRMLRKTVKMALRLFIVAVILVAAVVGSIAVWYLSSSPDDTPNLDPHRGSDRRIWRSEIMRSRKDKKSFSFLSVPCVSVFSVV